MSGELEITPGDQQVFQQSIKINNFPRFTESEEEFRSKNIEVFPGKKISFVVKTFSEMAPDGQKYNRYLVTTGGNWTAITAKDKFLSLELVAGEGVDPLRLAGEVEIILGGSNQVFRFGDPQKQKYLNLCGTNPPKLAINPKNVSNIKTNDGACSISGSAASLFHVKLSDAGEESTLEIKFTLYSPGEITENMEMDLPGSLESKQYVSDLNTKIMKDSSTADLKITCGEKNNKKVFDVHKSFFCARSPVFRAAVENDMLEARTMEIYIEEVDEKTVQEMIHYIYTGEFTGKDLNVQSVAWVADKYDLPGMMDLLCFRMIEDVEEEYIADMLIAAGKQNTMVFLLHTHFNIVSLLRQTRLR